MHMAGIADSSMIQLSDQVMMTILDWFAQLDAGKLRTGVWSTESDSEVVDTPSSRL